MGFNLMTLKSRVAGSSEPSQLGTLRNGNSKKEPERTVRDKIKMKNAFDGLVSRLDMAGVDSECEDSSLKSSQTGAPA